MRAARLVIWHDPSMPTLSQHQIEQIPKWLKSHQFKPVKLDTHPPEKRTWARDCCQVKIEKEDNGNDYVAKISVGGSDWVELGKYLAEIEQGQRREWLVHAPMEMAVSKVLGTDVSKRPLGERFYSGGAPPAYTIKVALQMVIGLCTVIALGWALTAIFIGQYHHVQHLYMDAAHTSILVITAGLAAAAAVELAYTLFTPGPDEAVDPLMLGLAAGILLLVTRDRIPVGWQFFGIIVGVIALGTLFYIRRRFIDSEE
jgi:hypothetical protein